MAKFNIFTCTVVLFLALVSGTVLLHAQPPGGNGKPADDVTVINPPENPVPTTIENDESNPVSTYDIDNPAFQPVQIDCEIVLPDSAFIIQENCTDQNVPLGKRLVIEQITAEARFTNNENFPRVSLGLISFDMNGDLHMVFHRIIFEQELLGTGFLGNVFYASQNVRLYHVQQGINISFFRDSSTGSLSGEGTLRVSIAGHFVDVN